MKVWLLTESYDTWGDGMSDPTPIGVFATWRGAELSLPEVHFYVHNYDGDVIGLTGTVSGIQPTKESSGEQSREYDISPYELGE